MKATGIVRKVDRAGRIVIPNELRTVLNLKVRDPIEIFVEDKDIILHKYLPACIFCNDATDVVHIKGKSICRNCLKELQSIK